MEQVFNPPGTIFAASFRFDTRMMDVEDGARFIVTNPHVHQENPLVRQRFRAVQERDPVFWLVTWFPPGSPENWFAQDLWRTRPFVQRRNIPGHQALWFDMGPAPEPETTGGWRFGTIELARYAVQRTERGLYVTLAWTTDDPPTQDHAWFVHLVNGEGQIAQQQDRQPHGGYRATSTWQPARVVIDRLFFPLESDANLSGGYLRIGYVDATSGERLPAFAPDSSTIAEGFIRIPLVD